MKYARLLIFNTPLKKMAIATINYQNIIILSAING